MRNIYAISLRCAPALLICLLSGCTNPVSNGMAPLIPSRGASRDRDPFADITGGSGGDGSVRSVTEKMKAASASSVSTDPNDYVTEDGQKVSKVYYTIYMHLYFRLNWLCKRVVLGELPKKFPLYVKRTQKEMLELSKTTVKDGNYKLVEKAVEHLRLGLERYRDIQDMYPLMNGMNSAPWRSGEVAMRTFIKEGGFGIGMSRVAVSDLNHGPKTDYESTDSTPQQASQKKALELAI